MFGREAGPIARLGKRRMLDTSSGAAPSFALNPDQIAVREMARTFAADVFAPHALAWDEAKHFPVAEMRQAAALGMGGVYISPDVGGSGLSRLEAALIFEALATGCPTVSAYMSIHNFISVLPLIYRRVAYAFGRVRGTP